MHNFNFNAHFKNTIIMKTNTFKTVCAAGLTFLVALIGCTNEATNEEQNLLMNPFEQLTTTFKTLENELSLGDNMHLPDGTQWRATNEQLNEVEFKLPAGYAFLMVHSTTNATAKTNIATLYTCVCTGTGTSKIFVLNNMVGCLQNTCDGYTLGQHTTSTDGMFATKVVQL